MQFKWRQRVVVLFRWGLAVFKAHVAKLCAESESKTADRIKACVWLFAGDLNVIACV
jgi:glucose-6-phosphate isomerase